MNFSSSKLKERKRFLLITNEHKRLLKAKKEKFWKLLTNDVKSCTLQNTFQSGADDEILCNIDSPPPCSHSSVSSKLLSSSSSVSVDITITYFQAWTISKLHEFLSKQCINPTAYGSYVPAFLSM